ncbi:hypothetical protein [Rhodococcus sp. NPDC127528]
MSRLVLTPIAYVLTFAMLLADKLLGIELPELLELNASDSTIAEVC